MILIMTKGGKTMLEVIVLLISCGIVFYNKGFLFGLGFLVVGWLVVGNIIKAIFKTDEAFFFPFAIAMGALAYYCAYVLR